MNDKDIHTIIEILKMRGREDLAQLLIYSKGSVEESGQYGSYLFSTISEFIIYAPLKDYFKLKNLSPKDRQFLLDASLDLYPHGDNAPEIVDVQFRILRSDEVIEQSSVETSQNIKIFVSYSNLDRVKAGEIKSFFENMGLFIFLAHEDITPSSEWEKRILQELNDCDVFLPLVSKNFKASLWTGQETGIALAKKKIILPVKIDVDPFGFISKYHACVLKSDNIKDLFDEIIDTFEEQKIRNKLIVSLIMGFCKSVSFSDANLKTTYLKKFQASLSNEQITQLGTSLVVNGQIDGGFEAKPFIQNLLRKNRIKSSVILENAQKNPIFENWDKTDVTNYLSSKIATIHSDT